MRGWRSLATASILVVLAVIETTWLSMADLPGSIPPLTLVAVFAYSLRRSPANAALLGFFTGVVIDLMPPSTTPLGVTALAFTIVGFLASMLHPYFEGSIALPLFGAAAAALVSYLLRIVISIAVGAEFDVAHTFIGTVLSAPLYAAMIMSALGPVSQFLDRLIAPRVQKTLFR